MPDSPSDGDIKLVFDYDYIGRRVRKREVEWDETLNGGNGGWKDKDTSAKTDLKFVYDQWNVVLVIDEDGENDTLRKYTWGLDMSGLGGNGSVQGIHGAGGIGGLLAAVDTQGTSSTADDKNYWFLYDGNGNIGQVLDATDHDPVTDMRIAAHYEHGPFGNTIVFNNDLREIDGDLVTSDGGYAKDNPFRFSNKYLDTEIDFAGTTNDGLYYYGYRYYSPRLGRWLNRDPIGEQGGLNLYGFLQNCPSSRVDPHGQLWAPIQGSWYALRCVCCLARHKKKIFNDASRALYSWMNDTGDTDPCHLDAMEHCLGGAVAAKKCGRCAVAAGVLLELVQWEEDPRDLHNNREGAKCAGAAEIVACCKDKLENGELNTTPNRDGSCH